MSASGELAGDWSCSYTYIGLKEFSGEFGTSEGYLLYL
jgi:hypothetical protein